MKPEDYTRAKALIDSKQMTLKDWAKGYATFNGGTQEDWTQAYQDREQAAKQSAAKATLAAAIEAYPVPKRLLKLLRQCAEYRHEYSTFLAIDFVLAEDMLSATAKAFDSNPHKPKRKKKGKDGENKGRKSAWVAYQEGQEMSDTFDIQKTGKRGIYVDMTDSLNPREIDRKEGGLCGYIRKAYPDSDAAKILYKFGYDRLG